MSPAVAAPAARVRVVALVVAHDGARWLPRLIDALRLSTRGPDDLIAIDTGSIDGSAQLLRDALGADRVVDMPRNTGFGDAVRAGIEFAERVRPSDSRHTARLTGSGAAGGRGTPVPVDHRSTGSAPGPGLADTGPEPEPEQWLWLLHDDCAPAPDALEELVAQTAAPDIAAVGCRVRAWPRARRLLELGVTISGTGRRETHVEPGEYDQGQYDVASDVLAVSTAGMLVRRTVWDQLGGLDPRLPLSRDDVDFGWRAAASGLRVRTAPRAVVFHAEAASRGVRAVDCAPARMHRGDRQAALYTLLANARPFALPFVFVRLVLGSLLRTCGYLLVKLPGAALDEAMALGSTLAHPLRIVGARRRRRRARTGPRRSVRRLRPPWWSPYAHAFESIAERTAGLATETAGSVAGRRRARADALESGPAADDSAIVEAIVEGIVEGPTLGDRLRAHPLAGLVLLLTGCGLVAGRGLWGGGYLHGGALPAAPNGAADWWRLLVETPHQVGLGTTGVVSPYVFVLAVPATVLLGKAWLIVDLVMLLSAPLAGWGAWALASRLVSGTGTRLWAATTYGLLPVVTGPVTTGHVGTVVAAAALPWVARGACAFGPPTSGGRGGASSWRAAWTTALPLSVACAFAPVCWPMAVAVGLVGAGWLVARRRARALLPLAVTLGTPVALLLPWSWQLLQHPARVLTEAGLTVSGPSGLLSQGWLPVFGRLGAAGAAPWWVSAGVIVAAVAALARSDTRGRVAAAWSVGALALVAAALMWHQSVTLPEGKGTGLTWIGVPVVVAAGCAIFAAAMAADGVFATVGAGSFGWRQPLAVVAVAIAVTSPVLSLGWWVAMAPHGELRRGPAVALPAYMVDAMEHDGQRVLVLRTDASAPGTPIDTIHADVLAGEGIRLGTDSVLPSTGSPVVAAQVAGLLSAGHAASADAALGTLGRLGVGYVVLEAPADPAIVSSLDARAGLTPTSTDERLLSGWQLAAPTAQAAPTVDGDRVLVLALEAVGWLVLGVLAAPGSRRPRLATLDARLVLAEPDERRSSAGTDRGPAGEPDDRVAVPHVVDAAPSGEAAATFVPVPGRRAARPPAGEPGDERTRPIVPGRRIAPDRDQPIREQPNREDRP